MFPIGSIKIEKITFGHIFLPHGKCAIQHNLLKTSHPKMDWRIIAKKYKIRPQLNHVSWMGIMSGNSLKLLILKQNCLYLVIDEILLTFPTFGKQWILYFKQTMQDYSWGKSCRPITCLLLWRSWNLWF